MKSLQDAVSKEQMKTLETTGHTLKGMLVSMSATRAALAASRLQEIGRGGKHSQLKEALAGLMPEQPLTFFAFRADIKAHSGLISCPIHH